LHYLLSLVLLSFFFSGCSKIVYITKPCHCPDETQSHLQKRKLVKPINSHHSYSKRVRHLRAQAASSWGTKAKVASRYEYVKYARNYKARTIINFETGSIRVETTARKHPKEVLRQVIATTLLSTQNPENIDLFSVRHTTQVGIPFLFNRVKDHEGKHIRWKWRAYKYADYLINKSLQVRRIKTTAGSKKRYAVNFRMKKERFSKASKSHYASIVRQQAKRFGLNPALIFALIETESHFNPFATSAIPAYGLMQVVPNSAGKDAWKFLKNRPGKPSRNYLFNAKNNIEMGSAYVHILLKRYLYKIKNPKTREYCAIAAYNTGSGNVLRCFSRNRKVAVRRINKLSPQAVFNHLRKKLPYHETRHYLVKVNKAKKRYL